MLWLGCGKQVSTTEWRYYKIRICRRLRAPPRLTGTPTKDRDSYQFTAGASSSVFEGRPSLPDNPLSYVRPAMRTRAPSEVPVQALAARFVRILAYDRAGMGQSQPAPGLRTAAAAARDLSDVLVAAAISGPYVLLCHSYGGFLAREFLHIRSDDVAGSSSSTPSPSATCRRIPCP